MKNVVTRFAPSPTGFLHLGSLRTALINFIITEQAKKQGDNSKLLLRIEDTDKDRSNKIYEESIINNLKWIGIKWDGKPHIQSENISRHIEIADQLLKKNKAYKCICTDQELEAKRISNQKNHINQKRLCTNCENDSEIQKIEENFCIRIKIPTEGNVTIEDNIQGKVTTNNIEIDNYIILRKDRTPTYMLSVVVDDNDMGVNTIIRGDDHLNNTFRQIHIYKHLNWEIPKYSHIPLIHGSDGKKLSKRHGSVDISDFKNLGYLPQSIINNLILLGWSPKNKNEIIEINEIIKEFDLKKISKSASIFDYDKLNHFNNYFIKQDKNYIFYDNFISKNEPLKEFYIKDKNKLFKIFEVYKNKINYYLEINDIAKIYYKENLDIVKNININDTFLKLLNEFVNLLNKVETWNKINLENNMSSFISSKKVSFSSFGKPLRILLINNKNGPSISEILYILGKENAIHRINKYINS